MTGPDSVLGYGLFGMNNRGYLDLRVRRAKPYAFSKSGKANISAREEAALSLVAESFCSADDKQIDELLAESSIWEPGVFAAILGIGKTTVQQWERGLKKPGGPALRLLDLLDRKGLAALG